MKNHLSYRFMPMIILSYLFINLYLIMIGSKWCESEGCEVSKSLLKIEQSDLYSIAILAFGILFFIGLKILKTDSERLKEFYKLGVFAIMICETILLSYLYFKTGSLCISCFIFYVLIVINYLIIDKKDKKIVVIFFIIATIAFLKLDVNTKASPSLTSKYTLLQSESCQHCKKVKLFLKENNIIYSKEEYISFDGLFSALNITKIPLMIVKKNKDNFILLNGVDEIVQYLKVHELEKVSKENEINSNSFSTHISLDEKEGCEINFLQKELENCNE